MFIFAINHIYPWHKQSIHLNRFVGNTLSHENKSTKLSKFKHFLLLTNIRWEAQLLTRETVCTLFTLRTRLDTRLCTSTESHFESPFLSTSVFDLGQFMHLLQLIDHCLESCYLTKLWVMFHTSLIELESLFTQKNHKM